MNISDTYSDCLPEILIYSWQLFENHTMRLILIIIASFILLSTSCKKEDKSTVPEADITLSSKTLMDIEYYSFGYSFELQKFVKKTLNPPDIIDIYLNKIISVSGKLTGVQFATNEVPASASGFFRNNSFANSADAVIFYDNYTTAIAPQLSILTDTVKANQIWTFKTWKNNYVKFLVKEVRKVPDGSSGDYIEVDIKYFIQRDGSTNLIE
jgi:hypothetical protein